MKTTYEATTFTIINFFICFSHTSFPATNAPENTVTAINAVVQREACLNKKTK
jgi:hypothetical protein